MKAPVSPWSSRRLRFWAMAVVIVAGSEGLWCGFEWWHQRHANRPTKRVVEELRTIGPSNEPLDLITGRSNVCEVHGTAMTVGTVPVVYGLMEIPRSNSLGVLATPHAGWPHAEGGCIVRSAPMALAYLCPECVARAASIPPEEAASATDAIPRTAIAQPPERSPFSDDDASFWQPKAILPLPDLSAFSPGSANP